MLLNMKRILFLDDSKDLCKLMENMFDLMGFTDVNCFNSYEEISKLPVDKLNFDLAFLDVNLGNDVPTGIDVFSYLLKHDFQGKVIFLTGHGRSYPALQKTLEHPNVRVLEKPTDIGTIEAILNE
jgi:DNA-binding NtrC family response regulator